MYTLTHITHCTTQVEDRRDHVVKGSKLKKETHIMCQLEIEVSNNVISVAQEEKKRRIN